ncbi:MAG: DNA polymerase III epsilon subunit-like protein, partial [Myxococcota bacterium]
AHSAASDLAYLVSETHRLSLDLPVFPFMCTLPMARRIFPAAPKYTLSRLAAHAGLVDLDDPDATFHRALADALHTRNLFGRFIDRTSARTLRDLGVRAAVQHPRPADFDVHVPEHLRLLEAALMASTRMSVVYNGGSKGRVRRPMTPLAFFADRGVPYLRAWCHLDDTAKSFRCDRISGVQPGE